MYIDIHFSTRSGFATGEGTGGSGAEEEDDGDVKFHDDGSTTSSLFTF